jgi:uncharacterized protein (DUF1778 family)
MPTVPTEQVARIEARISPELKAMFQTAADIGNITLSEFLTKSAREAAQEIISNHNVLRLNAEDIRAFADAISFYRRYGFIEFQTDPMKLYISMVEIEGLGL